MKALIQSIKNRIVRFQQHEPLRFRFFVGAGLVVLVIAAILLSVEPPWEGKTGNWVADGKNLRVREYVHIYSWWAALFNMVVIGTLALTSRWWWKLTELPKSTSTQTPQRQPKNYRLLSLAGLACAILTALWIRIPNLNHLLLLDEQDNLRRSIFGYAELDKDSGQPVFVKATWVKALFENKYANNPVLFSVAAKASNTVWQKFSGKGEFRFSRPALRLPSLVGGILSIVAFWWFMNLLGMPFSGVLAAFILALHPYHIDYSIQARGYGMMLFFVGAASCCALRAMQTGKWRWFAGLGASLFLTLGSYTGASYFVLTFGVAIAAYLCWVHLLEKDKGGRAKLTRLMVVGIISACFFIQLIAPSYPQMSAWLSEDFSKTATLGDDWITNAYLQYTTGVWPAQGVPKSERPDYHKFITDNLITGDIPFAILTFLLIPMFILAGIARFWMKGGPARTILLGGLFAPILAYCVHEFITHLWLHGWYILYFLPFLVILIATGLGGLMRCVGRLPTVGPLIAIVLSAAFLQFFWYEVRPGQAPWYQISPDEGPNRVGRRILPSIRKEVVVFNRGPFNWVVYDEGRMIRQPVGLEIPEQFPFDEGNLKVVIKH